MIPSGRDTGRGKTPREQMLDLQADVMRMRIRAVLRRMDIREQRTRMWGIEGFDQGRKGRSPRQEQNQK